MLIDEYKKQYLDQVILSNKNETPFNLPVNDPTLDNDEKFKWFKNEVDSLYLQYLEIKKLAVGGDPALVRSVLSYLKDLKDKGHSRKESYEAFKKIFQETGYKNLTADLQKKFEDGLSFLEKKISFFCSYTTKELPDINFAYEQVYLNYYGINRYDPEDLKKLKNMNYVAKFIVKHLNIPGSHNYFFDRDKLVNGDEIKQEIFNYCDRTVAFVVLAQQQTFIDEAGVTNWCFEEYKRYKASHGGQCLFIVYKIPGIRKLRIGNPEINDWFDYLTTDQGILRTTIEFNDSKETIKNNIIKDSDIINDKYDNLFSNMVNSIN